MTGGSGVGASSAGAWSDEDEAEGSVHSSNPLAPFQRSRTYKSDRADSIAESLDPDPTNAVRFGEPVAVCGSPMFEF